MPTGKHGLERAFGGVATALVLTFLAKEGMIPSGWVVLFNVASIIMVISLLDKVKYWSYSYSAGYVLGHFILMSSGFYTSWEVIGYGLLAVIMIIIKLTGFLPI